MRRRPVVCAHQLIVLASWFVYCSHTVPGRMLMTGLQQPVVQPPSYGMAPWTVC